LESSTSFYVLAQFVAPGGPTNNIGILLYDARQRRLLMRFRADYDFAGDEDVGILAGLHEDLTRKATEYSDPLRLVEHLEDTLSNAILITSRVALPSEYDADEAVDLAYARCVEQT
jgi:hypothetical protein